MSEMLGLRVAAKTWSDSMDRFPDIPYQDIVGATDETGDTVWALEYADGQPLSQYRNSDTCSLLIPSNQQLSQRLPSYLETYLRTLPVSDARETGEFNCHFFAEWISDVDNPQDYTARKRAVATLENGHPTHRNLKLGQIGVYAYTGNGVVSAVHSVIGRGEDIDECIQASGIMHSIAITNYSSMSAYYSLAAEIAGYSGLELYTVD